MLAWLARDWLAAGLRLTRDLSFWFWAAFPVDRVRVDGASSVQSAEPQHASPSPSITELIYAYALRPPFRPSRNANLARR